MNRRSWLTSLVLAVVPGAGLLRKRLNVCVAKPGPIMVGYKGITFVPGLVYAPWIPIIITQQGDETIEQARKRVYAGFGMEPPDRSQAVCL